MKKIIFSILFTMAASAVAVMPAFCQDPAVAKPNVLTEESIFTDKKIGSYDTLVIRDFNSEGAEYSRVDNEEKPKIDAMIPILSRTITDNIEMQLKLKKLFQNILVNAEPRENTMILEGSFTEFNAGSRALKLFVGFGAGKAYLKVKGRLIDAQTGQELAVFTDRETGYRGALSLESYLDLFPHQAKSIGENIAQFIEKLY
jgi:hypothetical protein